MGFQRSARQKLQGDGMSQSGEKTDLRVSRTQQALQTALLLLLEKTPFSKITVQTICQKAGVSRATFYMHYQDKYALLRVCLERLWQQANHQPGDHNEIVRRVVFLTYHNARLFKNIISDRSDQELIYMLSQAVVTDMMTKLEKRKAKGARYPVPEQILARFISGGMAHLLIWWMLDNCPTPPEEMAEHLNALAEHLDNFHQE